MLLRTSRLIAAWIVTVLLILLPIFVAADFGGILRWTQFVAGIVVVVITMMSLATYWDQPNRGQLRQHKLILPLLIWLAYAFFQTVPLAPGIVNLFSPASHDAYTQWLPGILPADLVPSHFPISVSPHDSRHVVAVMALVIGVVFASAMVFCTRNRIVFLLNAFSIGVAIHAVYGVLRLVFPNAALFDGTQDVATGSYGAFINRNNAALFMNFGLASSLGLLSWRLNALTGQELDDDQFEFNDLASLLGDRDSLIGILCALCCVAGLLLCGSRGGIASSLFGILLAFGWVRQRRGAMALPVIAVVVGISAAVLLLPLQLSLESIKRFEFFNSDARTFADDGRLMHWPDGLQAAISHLPGGSGMSTYAFSYLPNQAGVLKAWAQHADNLWLELLVEQGVFGVIAVVVILWMIIRSLVKLHESPDPIDQGLRTAGWYIIGVVVFSQIFDSGLILPANLFFLAIIFPAIVARRVSIGRKLVIADAPKANLDASCKMGALPRTKHESVKVFASRWQMPLFVALAALIVLLPASYIPTLKRDADVESLVRAVKFQLKSVRTDEKKLAAWHGLLQTRLPGSSDPQLLNALGDVKRSQARLAEVMSHRPKTSKEFTDLFEATKPIKRRLESGSLSRKNKEQYAESEHFYDRTLTVRPLDLDARAGKLYLDFLQGDSQRALNLIDQMFTLHRNNSSVLVFLGEYAANRQQYELAASLWKTATIEQASFTPTTINLSQKYDQISLSDVIPNNPQVARIAARQLLPSEDEESIEYLRFTLDAVECNECDSLEQKAACLDLHGDIAYKLQRYDVAFEQYSAAIASSPSNAAFRLKLVRRLREQGRIDEARIEARRGRTVIPSDKRFGSLIKAMAADDLRKATN